MIKRCFTTEIRTLEVSAAFQQQKAEFGMIKRFFTMESDITSDKLGNGQWGRRFEPRS